MFYKNVLDKDGLLLLKNFFTEEESNKIIEFADELENYKEEKGKWMIYFENGKKNQE